MNYAPTQFLGLGSQAPALVVIQAQPLVSELLAQRAVFFRQVFDYIGLCWFKQPVSEVSRSRKDRVSDAS